MEVPTLSNYARYSMLAWVGAGVLFILAVCLTALTGMHNEKTKMARVALLESLSLSSLAITSECDSARNPLEGVCSSAGDIPGGYPYHSSCDVVNPPEILKQSTFSIVKRKKM